MPRPQAAVAILRAYRPEPSVLLIRRTEREGDPWSGHWSFPGGMCEPDDTGPLATALRELAEECSILLDSAQLEAELPIMQARRRTPPFLQVAPFVFRVENQLPSTVNPHEAVEAVWVPLEVLHDPARHCLRPVPGMPPEMMFPCIELNGPPLWGFTYRLITEWLGLLPEARAQAGFEAASAVLDAMLASGARLRHNWHDGVAAVEGPIPVGSLAEYLAAWCGQIPCVNRVELRPETIRFTGLEFEEYRIDAA